MADPTGIPINMQSRQQPSQGTGSTGGTSSGQVAGQTQMQVMDENSKKMEAVNIGIMQITQANTIKNLMMGVFMEQQSALINVIKGWIQMAAISHSAITAGIQ